MLRLLPLFLILSLNAADYPLWDGTEPITQYAQRTNLPPTKTLRAGSVSDGIPLDLVLIPAGQFQMGEPKPEPPNITIEGSIALIWTGAITSTILLIYLLIICLRRRRFAFSLRWTMLMVIFSSMFFGGLARKPQAESAWQQYQRDFQDYESSTAKPAHPVTITRPFYMSKYTITQAQYQAVTGTISFDFKDPQLPVEAVPWDEATAFCKKLSPNCQLPTEAQWEYACRAGTKTNYYSGNADISLDTVAWHRYNSNDTSHPVGQKKPNAFGLYDMHGNVRQWCADFSKDDYYSSSPKNDPSGPKEGTFRVMRGGSWIYSPCYCRSSHRDCSAPFDRSRLNGFRIVILLD